MRGGREGERGDERGRERGERWRGGGVGADRKKAFRGREETGRFTQ